MEGLEKGKQNMPLANNKTDDLMDSIKMDISSDLLSLVHEKSSYLQLVKLFPLVPIIDQHGHESAVGMAGKVVEYLNQHAELPSAIREGINPYLNALTTLIEGYERSKFANVGRNVKGIDLLKFLMKEHGLKQTDLRKEVGGQSVVSELLSGKRRRKLNRKQIEALSKRFRVSPLVFFDQ